MADRIRAGVRRLLRLPPRTAARVRADADEELESFLQARVDELVARGASPVAARAEALRRLGGETLEDVRERLYRSATRREGRARFREAVEGLGQDVRFAVRQLVRAPGFAVVAVLTLALGLGASTAIFSAVHPILLEPLPYPHAGRIIMVTWDKDPDGARLEIAFGTRQELAARSRSFESMAVMRAWQPALSGAAEPERVEGQRVSASYFRALGVPPAIGRDFEPSEDRPGAPRAAILSDGLWRRRFGGDRAIVGRRIVLDDDTYSVVGVMPRGFENVLAPGAELWTPLRYDMSLPQAWGHHLRMVGRLSPGVSAEQGARELDAIARAPLPEFPRAPWAALGQGFIANPLQADLTRGVRPALLAVLGAVLLLLVIACVNVTNLLLARGAGRRAELALRAAIGAGRLRLVRQLLTESLLLALVGGALGMVVAELGVRALVALAPPGLPRAGAVRLDGAALAFGMGLTTLVGLAFGLAPALQASRGGLHAGMRRRSDRRVVTRRALVVAEVALALVLLVGAGLLLRSLRELFAVAPGFEPSRLLTMQVQTTGRRFDEVGATERFAALALDAVRRVPGVAAAAFTSQLPLSGDLDEYGVHFESRAGAAPAQGFRGAFRYAVSPGYFEAMGIPLRAGRLLDAHDVAGAPVAVLLSESLARRSFPGRDPIGQRLRVGPNDGPWSTVVGVVGDVRQASLAVSQPDAVYLTSAQWRFPDRALSLVVRASGDDRAALLAPAVTRAVWSVDKDQPVTRVATMDDLLARSAAERRFALVLFEAFAAAALALAAIGLYGVLAGGVTERTREIGVRAALGATRGSIVGLVVRQGATLVAAGAAVGLAGAAAASEALATLLFGISRLDPVTYLTVVALLVGVSVVACLVPAWRAARVDPSIALRAE